MGKQRLSGRCRWLPQQMCCTTARVLLHSFHSVTPGPAAAVQLNRFPLPLCPLCDCFHGAHNTGSTVCWVFWSSISTCAGAGAAAGKAGKDDAFPCKEGTTQWRREVVQLGLMTLSMPTPAQLALISEIDKTGEALLWTFITQSIFHRAA